jgi:dienelactone hydrolase
MSFLTLGDFQGNRNDADPKAPTDIDRIARPDRKPRFNPRRLRSADIVRNLSDQHTGVRNMPKRSMKQDDLLEDFKPREITLDGVTKVVHAAGSGPAVIVMTEMPGISPQVARFARWVRDAGFTVYMPSLFGRDGAVPGADEGAAVFQRACVSAEFRALAANESSPVTKWLRSLARLAHDECGGPGVGAIGMCFTGNFALTMMLEPSMLAPVLSATEQSVRHRNRSRRSQSSPRAARAGRFDRDGLSLRGGQVLHGATLRGL